MSLVRRKNRNRSSCWRLRPERENVALNCGLDNAAVADERYLTSICLVTYTNWYAEFWLTTFMWYFGRKFIVFLTTSPSVRLYRSAPMQGTACDTHSNVTYCWSVFQPLGNMPIQSLWDTSSWKNCGLFAEVVKWCNYRKLGYLGVILIFQVYFFICVVKRFDVFEYYRV